MHLTPLKDVDYNTSNIDDDITLQWDNTSSYEKETTRQINNKLYRNYAKVEQLVTYIYNNTDSSLANYTTNAVDGTIVSDNTAVPCIQSITTVYVVDNNTYYMYNSASGNVNFTTEDITSPSNFTEITNARHTVDNPEDSPLIWEYLGYTNKYKMLDKSLSSQTVVSGDMEFSFVVNKIDSIFFFNVLASSIRVKATVQSSGIVIKDDTFSMSSKDGGTWYNYFFNDFVYETKLNADIPLNFDVLIEITIENFGGTSKCGLVGVGKSEYLGGTLYGAGIGMVDFSKKLTNETTGESYFEQGNFKSTNSLTIDVPSGLTDRVTNILTKYRSVPVVFIGAKDFKSTYIFGIYNKYNTLISTPTISKLTLDLESLI